MAGILVIEPTSTLAHLLLRALQAGGYEDHTLANSYEDAMWYLQEAEFSTDFYQAILLGVPGKKHSRYEEILDKLAGGPMMQTPVLLLAHQDDDFLGNWRRHRAMTSFVPWSQFGKIPSALAKMLSHETREDAVLPSQQSKLEILFVDDSQSVRFAYRQLLEAQAYPVDVAASLEEARTSLKNKAYDLVICDYFLPDGTGDELCRELTQKGDGNQFISIITGTYRESVIRDCLDAGAMECMFKNEAKELFVARVNAMCRAIETRKKVEHEHERLDGILSSVADGVYGVDNQGQVNFINPAACQMLHFTSEQQVVGRSAHDVFHYADAEGCQRTATECRLQKAYESGEELRHFETVFQTSENRNLPVECSIVPLTISNERQGSVIVFRDISQHKDAERLRWEVTHDELTGLLNRQTLLNQMEEKLAQLARNGQNGAILYLDIDRYHHLEDLLGTTACRKLLKEVAGKLSSRMREGDLLCRMDGDIFVIYLHAVQMENLFVQAEDLRNVVSNIQYKSGHAPRNISASIGVAIIGDDAQSVEFVLNAARQSCQEAKKKGRNQTHIYLSSQDNQTRTALDHGWKERFREAIDNNRFQLMAQPIVNLEALDIRNLDQIAGKIWKLHPRKGFQPEFIFELLLRMRDGQNQWISPAVFVPLAERVGMANEVDLWVVKRAIRNLQVLGETRYPVSFTINLSNHTLQDGEMMNTIRSLIASSSVDAASIIFEITETAAIEHLSAARKAILALRAIGCQFALDDFGTGFSSFAHLKHLPVDFLKIDGMFVETMLENETDRTMVESINAMAHSLGLKTIAEHVDSQAGLKLIRDLGGDYVQGHFLGEPMPLSKINFQAFRKKPVTKG